MVSDIGTWVQLVTIATLVASESGKATSTALISAATFGPQGLCSPLGGLLADRHDRRRVFLSTLGVQTIVTAGIAVALANGLRNANTLALMVVLQAGAGALGAPSFGAILPDLVPKDQLLAASSLSMMGWNAGRVVGPAVAGLLQIAGAGPAWAIGLNAASFVVLWLAVALVRRPFRPAYTTTTGKMAELVAGARGLVSSHGCRFATLTMVVLQFTIIPFVGLVPYMASEILGRPKGTAGLLNSVQGVAAIAGMLLVPSLVSRYGRSTMVTLTTASSIVGMVVYITSTTVVQAAIGAGLLGLFMTGTISLIGSMIQRDAPPDKRGRILSLYIATVGLMYGVGLMMFGWLSDVIGIRTAFLVGSGVLAVCTFFVARNKQARRTVDGSDLPATRG